MFFHAFLEFRGSFERTNLILARANMRAPATENICEYGIMLWCCNRGQSKSPDLFFLWLFSIYITYRPYPSLSTAFLYYFSLLYFPFGFSLTAHLSFLVLAFVRVYIFVRPSERFFPYFFKIFVRISLFSFRLFFFTSVANVLFYCFLFFGLA